MRLFLDLLAVAVQAWAGLSLLLFYSRNTSAGSGWIALVCGVIMLVLCGIQCYRTLKIHAPMPPR